MPEGAAVPGPAVAILPYGTRIDLKLADIPLDRLTWPLGRPERLSRGRVSDLGPDDHLLCFVTSRLLYMPRPRLRARVSVMLVEPEAIHGAKMRWIRLIHRRFYRVLTCNPGLLSAIPNGVKFIYGSSWVPEWRELDTTKSRMVSLIASSKTDLPGHRLRHELVARIQAAGLAVDVIGRGYKPFERKAEGLASYRYSVVLENVREPGLVTEKLIDCLLCRTVPLYWGAPDIGELFDTGGMILCTDGEEFLRALSHLSEEDYRSRLEFIEKNREKAARYADYEKAAARLLLKAAEEDRTSQ